MQKSILISCTAFFVLCFTACGYTQSNTIMNPEETASTNILVFERNLTAGVDELINLDLIYKVESRFMTRITKEKLHNAKSIIDILPKKATQFMETYENVRVSILGNDGEITEIGVSEILNEAQLKLLQSADYSTNFHINADCKQKTEFGKLYDYDLVYYMTVVPEKEAEFTGGQDALIQYLKTNTQETTTVITKDKLQPGKVNFTVTKDGKITNVKLDSTSGFPSVDEKLIETIENMPKKWTPATNAKGENVDQELVFFFGLEGC